MKDLSHRSKENGMHPRKPSLLPAAALAGIDRGRLDVKFPPRWWSARYLLRLVPREGGMCGPRVQCRRCLFRLGTCQLPSAGEFHCSWRGNYCNPRNIKPGRRARAQNRPNQKNETHPPSASRIVFRMFRGICELACNSNPVRDVTGVQDWASAFQGA